MSDHRAQLSRWKEFARFFDSAYYLSNLGLFFDYSDQHSSSTSLQEASRQLLAKVTSQFALVSGHLQNVERLAALPLKPRSPLASQVFAGIRWDEECRRRKSGWHHQVIAAHFSEDARTSLIAHALEDLLSHSGRLVTRIKFYQALIWLADELLPAASGSFASLSEFMDGFAAQVELVSEYSVADDKMMRAIKNRLETVISEIVLPAVVIKLVDQGFPQYVAQDVTTQKQEQLKELIQAYPSLTRSDKAGQYHLEWLFHLFYWTETSWPQLLPLSSSRPTCAALAAEAECWGRRQIPEAVLTASFVTMEMVSERVKRAQQFAIEIKHQHPIYRQCVLDLYQWRDGKALDSTQLKQSRLELDRYHDGREALREIKLLYERCNALPLPSESLQGCLFLFLQLQCVDAVRDFASLVYHRGMFDICFHDWARVYWRTSSLYVPPKNNGAVNTLILLGYYYFSSAHTESDLLTVFRSTAVVMIAHFISPLFRYVGLDKRYQNLLRVLCAMKTGVHCYGGPMSIGIECLLEIAIYVALVVISNTPLDHQNSEEVSAYACTIGYLSSSTLIKQVEFQNAYIKLGEAGATQLMSKNANFTGFFSLSKPTLTIQGEVALMIATFVHMLISPVLQQRSTATLQWMRMLTLLFLAASLPVFLDMYKSLLESDEDELAPSENSEDGVSHPVSGL